MHSIRHLIGLWSLSQYIDVHSVIDLLLKQCRLKAIGGTLLFLLVVAHSRWTYVTGHSNSQQCARGCVSVTLNVSSQRFYMSVKSLKDT